MNIAQFVKEASMGGPGLDGYAYRADVYCIECGRRIIREIAPEVAPKLINIDDPLFRDSETVPQPIFFGESGSAQHCAECGDFLYGTPPGPATVHYALAEARLAIIALDKGDLEDTKARVEGVISNLCQAIEELSA